MADRRKQLGSIMGQFPAADKQTAAAQEQARALQLRQAVGKAAQGTEQEAKKSVGTIAGQQAATAGQQQIQRQQQTDKNLLQAGQQGLQQRSTDAKIETKQLEQRLDNEVHEQKIANMEHKLNSDVANEEKMIAWSVSNAKDAAQFAEHKQKAMLMEKRRAEVAGIMHKSMMNAIDQKMSEAERLGNAEERLRLTKIKAKLKEKYARDAARAKSRGAMWQAAGSAAGTALGASYGPAGAALGGALGGVAGSAIGGLFE